ncbi:sensor histidine kinase [Ilumatobacter nonamiensis]|uniref:sensor histidine kinase n=1 Tax=Ilumatobacter nonamiensis TaxID=467093 RepID=UPI000686C3D7|nr:HAMP domain-containing sensor histidine kinase [Ilumatobacter nonamiensis]
MLTDRPSTSHTLRPPRTSVRRRAGLRLRIVVGFVLLLASVLAFVLFATRQVLLSELDQKVAAALNQEVEELRLLADGTDPETGEPFADDVQALFDTFLSRNVPSDDEAFYTLVDAEPYRASSGALALADDHPMVEEWRRAVDSTNGTGSTDLGDARYLVVPLVHDGDVLGAFAVVSFPGDERDQLLSGVRTAAIIGVIALAIAAVIAWAAAGRILRPVREITTASRRITETDLSERIPVDGADELAELGRTLNEMLDRLENGFSSQRRFLDDVAHELRTPITIAQGHLDLIEHDDPGERRETVALVTDELERMSRYVGDLLVLAKADRPDFLGVGPVDLGELTTTLLHRVSTLGDRTWTVESSPPPGMVAIVADEGRLSQAMLNLASNAVQHTMADDEIRIGAELIDAPEVHGGPWARLWVRDSGPGVDPDVLPTLFDRQTRSASSRVRRPDGMGLGLSIVDAIARAHGGYPEVQSSVGAGATFAVVIPTNLPANDEFRVVSEATA